MEGTFLTVIIEPLLNIRRTLSLSLCERQIKRNVYVSPHIFIENICGEVLTIIGLGHLTNTSEASIFVPNSKFSPLAIGLTAPGITVGHLKAILGEQLYIKISAKGEPGDFTEESMTRNLFINLIRIFLKEAPYIEIFIKEPYYKNIIEKIKTATDSPKLPDVSLQSIVHLKELVEQILCQTLLTPLGTLPEPQFFTNAINNVNNSINNKSNDSDNNESSNDMEKKIEESSGEVYIGIPIPNTTTSTSKESDTISLVNSLSNELYSSIVENSLTDISNNNQPMENVVTNENETTKEEVDDEAEEKGYKPITEKEILERWYQKNPQMPSFQQLTILAGHLNNVFEHSEDSKITGEYLFWWYIRRTYNMQSKLKMSKVFISVTIESMVTGINPIDNFLPNPKIMMALSLNNDILLKDVCEGVLNKIGMENLSNHSNAHIILPDSKKFSLNSFDSRLNLTIGDIGKLVGETLVVKIMVYRRIENSTIEKSKRTMYFNLIQFLLKEVPSIPNWISNSSFRKIVEKMSQLSYDEIPYSDILEFNEIIEREIYSYNKTKEEGKNAVNFNVNLDMDQLLRSTPMTLNVNFNSNPQGSILITRPVVNEISSNNNSSNLLQQIIAPALGRNPRRNNSSSRSKLAFDAVEELPLLERWYQEDKMSAALRYRRHASHLNRLLGRPQGGRITSRDIKFWFKQRRRYRSLSEMILSRHSQH